MGRGTVTALLNWLRMRDELLQIRHWNLLKGRW